MTRQGPLRVRSVGLAPTTVVLNVASIFAYGPTTDLLT
jgi:hypothetical protein